MDDFYQDKSVLVTGGAGFIGSHLVDRLIEAGARVTVVDSLVTGRRENIQQHNENERFRFLETVVGGIDKSYLNDHYDLIFHLASPASPKDFVNIPVETFLPNAYGTHQLLEYVKERPATRFLYTSTSEVYGDPQEHPQREDYWGHVNPIGIRSPYDVSKRFGEMVTMTFVRKFGADARIVRIFNTYGPRMAMNDGRVIPSFVTAALKNEPITVYGDGKQTRSFCYVSDLVEFLWRAMLREEMRGEVVNIGNPDEYEINQIAEIVKQMIQSQSEIIHADKPEDDPFERRPEMSKAMRLLEYEPQVSFEEGLRRTVEELKERMATLKRP